MEWSRALGALVLSTSFMFIAPSVVRAEASPSIDDDETPVTLDPLAAHKAMSGARSWRAPDYASQATAMGWSPNAFAIPKGLEKRVQFWMDIYTRYSTSQGVVHDAEKIDLIYEVVDFRDLEKQTLPLNIKEKLKRKMVEDAKKRAQATLAKLATAKNGDSLTPWEKRVWDAFAAERSPTKFREAMTPARLRFQLGQKDRMESAMFLSGRYLEDFERVFRENHLPIELTRIIFVESSFNVLARSKVGASGLWQIMPSVARPYHAITPAVDGRNHPLTATRMAAHLLIANYQMLGSWPLAVTAYNHGAAGVRKLVDKNHTRDLATIIENDESRVSFGFASKNFYASFLAASMVEREADKYFPNLAWSNRLDAEELKLPQTIKYGDLLTWFNYDDKKLQVFNPHLTWRTRKGFAIKAGTPVLIPTAKYSEVLLALGRKGREVANVGPLKQALDQGKQAKKVHRVARGENLTAIAHEYGISLEELAAANKLDMNDSLRAGQRLRIPR